MPAPLPIPYPPSSPLAAGTDKPIASAAVASRQRPTSNEPSVKVYDEMEYVCKPGDSFDSISKEKLLSEKYAKALQRHNQQHARASKRMGETGQITPGERIFIPQAYILEELYSDAIMKPAASPSSNTTVPAGFVPTNGSPPPIPAPTPPAPLAPLPSSPSPNP